MICCWDYVFRPTDDKNAGLADLFIKEDSPAMINVSERNRKQAPAFLLNPMTLVGLLKGSHRQQCKLADGFKKGGGAVTGGAGHYNLMAQAIEVTMPECMSNVDVNLMKQAAKGTGNLHPSAGAQKIVREIAQYWGAGVVDLSIIC